MYKEDRNSVSLMKLKTFYQDKRESNHIWMRLFKLKKNANDFLEFVKLPLCVGKKRWEICETKSESFCCTEDNI